MGRTGKPQCTPIRHPEPRLASNMNERAARPIGPSRPFVRQRKAHERFTMLGRLLLGAVAGAAGNLTLEIVTYGDMLLRGRAASGVPAKMVATLADDFGIEALASATTGNQAEHRRRPARVHIGGWARWRLRSRTPDPGAGVDATSWRRGWPRGDDRGRCVLCRNRRL